MKRLLFVFIISLVGLFLLLSEINAKLPAEENLIQKIKEVLTPTVSVPKNLPADFHPICATPYFLWIPIYRDELKLGTNWKLLGLLDRPDSSYTVPESTYNTPSGNFKIHYVTSSVDSVYQSHVDVSPFDSVPDYVNFIGAVLDYVWAKEVDSLGYNQPPSDSWYPPGYDNGGDGRYDVYLKNLDYYYLGFCQPEYSNDPWEKSYCSYFVLRNDYSLYGGSWENYIKVTSAHEFFHAIQFGYDTYEQEYVPSDPIWQYHPYWMELTATWMEDMIYDNINDYVTYLPFFYNYPWLSLKTFSYDSGDPPRYYHAYASCVWAFYLSENFGTDIIKDIWTRCGQTKYDDVLPATDSILMTKGSSLDQAFREFSVWNYFTNYRADTINYYSEGNLYPVIKVDPTQIHYGYPVNDTVPHPPEVLGTNYINFVVDPDSSGGLNLHFNGSDSAEWKASVIGYSSTNSEYFAEFNLDSQQSGNLEFHNWNDFDNIIMIPAVVTKTTGSFNYSYSAIYDSTLTEVKEQPDLVPHSFALSQNHPNPFNPFTTIQFRVGSLEFGEPIHATLSIYNILGQKVKTLVDGKMLPGNYQVSWNGEDDKGEKVGSGIYFYRFEAGDYSETKKMILIK